MASVLSCLIDITWGCIFVQIKDRRYSFHPISDNISRKREERKIKKIIKNDNNELEVKRYPKKQKPITKSQKLNFLLVLVVDRTIGLNLLKDTIVQDVNLLLTNKKIR